MLPVWQRNCQRVEQRAAAAPAMTARRALGFGRHCQVHRQWHVTGPLQRCYLAQQLVLEVTWVAMAVAEAVEVAMKTHDRLDRNCH